MSPQLYQDTIQSVPPWHNVLQFWASNTANSGVALPSNLKLLFYESALLTLSSASGLWSNVTLSVLLLLITLVKWQNHTLTHCGLYSPSLFCFSSKHL